MKTVYLINKIEVSFPIGNGSTYDLTLDLFAGINPETVKTNVTLHKIEIILEKLQPELSWTTLNAPQEVPVVASKPAPSTTTATDGPKPITGSSIPVSKGPQPLTP